MTGIYDQHSAFWDDLLVDLQDPEFYREFEEATIDLMQQYQDYKLEEIKRIEEESKTHDEWTDCTGRTYRVHKRGLDCEIDGCAIHNPSFHPLSEAKQLMREDKFWLIERICKHGVGHPDPDSASFISRQLGNNSIWVHGCDGCCNANKAMQKKALKKIESGWGPHVHQLSWADDGMGHSGMACISCDYVELD
ncbi:hypothetical protein HWB05_gp106 [Streptomyces phage BRock]|uniref:Uncharacterized protein n=1 Tax=Streptomyces phage BRock TaxID=1913591 RepID=A0A1J0GW15_9CAUD|nr:hypothetical protein HWB05_gp106 [Streptomyces phage BRock]APC46368.1 hypothetical protein [Streptomyces phage BRock]